MSENKTDLELINEYIEKRKIAEDVLKKVGDGKKAIIRAIQELMPDSELAYVLISTQSPNNAGGDPSGFIWWIEVPDEKDVKKILEGDIGLAMTGEQSPIEVMMENHGEFYGSKSEVAKKIEDFAESLGDDVIESFLEWDMKYVISKTEAIEEENEWW